MINRYNYVTCISCQIMKDCDGEDDHSQSHTYQVLGEGIRITKKASKIGSFVSEQAHLTEVYMS